MEFARWQTAKPPNLWVFGIGSGIALFVVVMTALFFVRRYFRNARNEHRDQEPQEARPHQGVGGKQFTANGHAMNAELQARRDFRQRRFGARAAGQAVGDDADVMAAVGLAVGQIQDMAKNSTDRRARCVKDTKRPSVNHRHDQNQRSPTSTVSPGLSGVPGGTT